MGQGTKNEKPPSREENPLGLFQVQAKVYDFDYNKYRVVMHFCAIQAYGKEDAIDKCREFMGKYIGYSLDYKWEAEPEYMNDLSVN